MTSSFEDVSQWRLRSNNGTVPMKFLGLEGDFESESASINFKALIPSNQVIKFMQETFPPNLIVGNLSIPQSTPLPGLPGLIAKSVSFKHLDSSLPIDPFGFDPGAPSGTYYPVVEVNIKYGMDRLQQPDPTDPRTFLEITARGSGQFLHTTAPGSKWQHQAPNPNDDPDSREPGSKNKPRTQNVPGVPVGKSTDTEQIKDPTIPMMVIVPTTEWNVKWKQIPFDYFSNIVIYRLRYCLGLVNALPFPLLFNAEPETILFDGYNYSESFTWRDGKINAPPIDLEMKFIEKRVVWNGNVCGHNHVWKPSTGWTYVLLNGKTAAQSAAEYDKAYDAWKAGGKKGNPPSKSTGGPLYQSRDLNVLFRV